jgi:chromosome segregation ATPase
VLNIFQIPSDVVSFSRRIGLKYDQFSINKKMIPRKEMVDVLVSAGFCSCNTYHIVKQGKVHEILLYSKLEGLTDSN